MSRTTIRRSGGIVALAIVLLSLAAPAALAHGPDPQLGTSGRLWGQDQTVAYTWRSGQVPPGWMAMSIDNGAADVAASRASRAALFVRSSGAASLIAYGGLGACASYAIACMDRSGVPSSFVMWFRPHGTLLDWGTLRWCQAQTSYTDGCYDAENIALDELGHVEILGHHVNLADGSDFTDAVVQASPHTRPRAGWNEHVFGRCDVARLQMEYELRNAANALSSCLHLATTLSLGVSATSIYLGGSVRFTARLIVTASTAARNLSNDPLSARSVLLQRRPVGGTTWTTIATLAGTTTAGTYATTWAPTATYEWRALFQPLSGDGAVASSSGPLTVMVSGCSGSGCPSSIGIGP